MQKSDEGRTTSYWESTEELLNPERLAAPIETDVCVIGAGIAGLTTAYLLAKEGHDVVVVDDGLIGGGETCRTTAHLSDAIDDRIYRIEKWHGEEKAKLAVEAHTRAIDEIERISIEEGIDCDLQRVSGYLIKAEDGEDDFDEEFDAARRAGLDVEWAERAPLPSFDSGRCLKFSRQGQFHVLKYLNGLARAIEQNGGRLFSHTKAEEWTGGEQPCVRTADHQKIVAKSIVLATNYPLKSKMFAKLPSYRTYAIGVELPKGSVEPALIWDDADPYIYVRTQEEESRQILIVGGEDHRTGKANDGEARFQNLLAWTRERYPNVGDITNRWSGQVFETHDGLAFIGQYSSSEPNIYLITGDSGMGMTHGTIGGMLVKDLITGIENPWTEVFEPGRLATQSITEAVPEILDSTTPYIDWVTGGDIADESELKPGDGGILREGLSKIAVYRDEKGEVHRRSAVCTHMGCVVRFNGLEKTWDCPCHGSRFSTDGEVINSPAIAPLSPAE